MAESPAHKFGQIAHPIYEGSGEFRKYEVQVEFSNGDKIDAFFDSKQRVHEFLNLVAV